MDFVNEGKLDEERKKRQAEWERVRNKDDPVEAPPEVFDNRSLFDKLKEQHELKKKEFEDKFALKNQVSGLDVDDAKFLNEIDEIKLKREKEIRFEEITELEEIKKASYSKSPSSNVPKINISLPPIKKDKQAELLSSIVVNKRKSNAGTTSTSTLMMGTDCSFTNLTKSYSDSDSSSDDENDYRSKKSKCNNKKRLQSKTHIVVGILPGVGEYDTNSSSLSENTSEDENDDNNDGPDLDTNEIISRGSKDKSAAGKLTK